MEEIIPIPSQQKYEHVWSYVFWIAIYFIFMYFSSIILILILSQFQPEFTIDRAELVSGLIYLAIILIVLVILSWYPRLHNKVLEKDRIEARPLEQDKKHIYFILISMLVLSISGVLRVISDILAVRLVQNTWAVNQAFYQVVINLGLVAVIFGVYHYQQHRANAITKDLITISVGIALGLFAQSVFLLLNTKVINLGFISFLLIITLVITLQKYSKDVEGYRSIKFTLIGVFSILAISNLSTPLSLSSLQLILIFAYVAGFALLYREFPRKNK